MEEEEAYATIQAFEEEVDHKFPIPRHLVAMHEAVVEAEEEQEVVVKVVAKVVVRLKVVVKVVVVVNIVVVVVAELHPTHQHQRIHQHQ